MSISFSRSIRSLAADGFRRSRMGMLIAVVLLTLWAAWFCLARVTLYEVTTTARLEVKQAVYPIEAPVEGRVVATHLVLGQRVQAGDVLVELESDAQRLQLEEEQTGLAALTAQRDGIRREIIAEKEVQDQERQVATVALAEARARHHEAEVAAQAAQKEADVYTQMRARGLTSQLELLRVTASARRHRAAANALRLAIDRLKGEQQTRESGGKLRLERLKGEATELAGQIVEAKVAIERPEYEITRRLIRSPVAGRLGEVGLVQIGKIIHGGDKLGIVVPPGVLKIIAHFLPSKALGRIQPGQPARLRLEGFPWTQYGTVAARVTHVASELRDKLLRVELTADADAASPIPFQHGLPGTVEVEVERVSPATLVLRTAGLRLAAPETSAGLQDDGRADR